MHNQKLVNSIMIRSYHKRINYNLVFNFKILKLKFFLLDRDVKDGTVLAHQNHLANQNEFVIGWHI